jgi:hypothetical protein
MEDDDVSLSHWSEFTTSNTPPLDMVLTSDVLPVMVEHLQPAFSTICECFLMYEGRIVAPRHGGYFITINGPCVSCEHDTTASLNSAVEAALLSQVGVVLENGVQRVASFMSSHAESLLHHPRKHQYFSTHQHYRQHRSIYQSRK